MNQEPPPAQAESWADSRPTPGAAPLPFAHVPRVTPRPTPVPKLCGGDIELGNFVAGDGIVGQTSGRAARLLLGAIEGYPVGAAYRAACGRDDQDWGRKFLRENGGCVYIDLDHLELALPEVLSAWDHVACWQAMLRLARRALDRANGGLGEDQRIIVLVNNTDGHGQSYGSHLDFLITRRAWDNLFVRCLHHLLFLASFQASSLVYTGQGKVGVDNDLPWVPYQVSQRADFFEVLMSIETTRRRPLVNCRDEPLCGSIRTPVAGAIPALDLARLHSIFFDNTLCQVSSLLKVGVMQLVLAMIESERVNPALILERPLEATWRWSHDPSLKARVRLIDGRETTAVELQLRFLDEAMTCFEQGGFDGVVPRAGDILQLWAETLARLKAKDYPALARQVDWVLKAALLQRLRDRQSGLTWRAPELKRLDLMYGAMPEGLYWTYDRQGLVTRLVDDAHIERFTREPPEDTRAWTRAMLLRCAAPEQIDSVDWDELWFSFQGSNGWPLRARVSLANPLRSSKATNGHLFNRAARIEEVVVRLNEASGVAADADQAP
ncbi:MAG: proteasome accessory factor PafA2 family protein [Verrucomicrobia bacterium]|nr:proteasome accessory factor PafA2 family protein [Verrucomicrobiota bacterium]